MDILRAENINSSYYKNIEKDKNIARANCCAENSIFPFRESETFNYLNNSDVFMSSNISDSKTESLKEDLEKLRDDQGVIGKLWDGFKNLTGIGAGSNKAEAAAEQYENGEISYEEAQEKLENYKKGQETVVDITGDIVSGIIAVGAFALAVPTGGASLVAGLGIAAAAGAGTKIAVKAGDAIIAGRDYTGKDLLYDTATGATNGLFAPVTNGIGACITKTVGKKLGLTVVKEGTKEAIEQAAKQGIKSIITQQGVDVIGGTFLKRAAATAAGMAADGAVGGSTDNMLRAALNGEDAKGIIQAGVEGAIGGLIMAPVIGGGFKAAGKLGKSLNNKITTKSVFSNGMDTVFKQGETGDCALLSFINGAMKSDDAQDLIKKSITKSAFGDYHVKIGNQTIDIPASSLTDDILSDTTGVKLFEAAYKKMGGSIDGEFAENVAKQFGLNPVHIAADSITDETLDKIAKEQGTILSFGTKIDTDGRISTNGTNHYFTIQDVDTLGKKVTLSDPYDTSKLIELSYEDIKKFGISIDGGTVNKTDLLNSARNIGETSFKGNINSAQTSHEEDLVFEYIQKTSKKTGTPLTKDDLGDFSKRISPFATFNSDGTLNVRLMDGTGKKISILRENIDGEDIFHLYDESGEFITSIYRGGICPEKDFTKFLSNSNDTLIIGKNGPNVSELSNEEMIDYYTEALKKLNFKDKENPATAQEILDIFPKDAKTELILHETNATISDGVMAKWQAPTTIDGSYIEGGQEWFMRIHSQDSSSLNPNWIFRIGYKDACGTKYYDLKTGSFSGAAKGAESVSSHISIKGPYEGAEELLNDGNFSRTITMLSQHFVSDASKIDSQYKGLKNFLRKVTVYLQQNYKKEFKINMDQIKPEGSSKGVSVKHSDYPLEICIEKLRKDPIFRNLYPYF